VKAISFPEKFIGTATVRGMTKTSSLSVACSNCQFPCPVQDYPATLCQQCLQWLMLERNQRTLRPATRSEFWALFDHSPEQYTRIIQHAWPEWPAKAMQIDPPLRLVLPPFGVVAQTEFVGVGQQIQFIIRLE
jgi:hypothetical protein